MMTSQGRLMSEEDIRQYFIQNGGIVRNTDIVTYFRAYLSNPAIRDEARVLFKTYVNKLAAVKVENGEKFLVLKRQYFLPIDGNGNATKQSTLNSYPSTTSISSSSYGQSFHGGPPPNFSSPPNPYASNVSGSVPYGYPPPVGVNNNNNILRRQNSQPQLYGSHFSLNSNYADPYNNNPTNMNYSGGGGQSNPSTGGVANFYPASHFSQPNSQNYPPNPSISNINNAQPTYQYPQNKTQQQPPPQHLMQQNHSNFNHGHMVSNLNQNQGSDYPPEYGLPPVPLGNPISSPPRRLLSPQNSYGSGGGNGSPSSRAPPPYRPPPPAGRFTTSPTGPAPNFSSPPHGISRRSSMSSTLSVPYHRTNSVPGTVGPGSYYSTSSTQNVNLPHESTSPPNLFQYQRSVSVTGLPQAVNNSSATLPGEGIKYLENSLGGAPPPPVPPRSRRSVERSPSAANSVSSSSSSNRNSGNNGGLRNRFGTKMEVECMNNNDSSSSQSQPQQATHSMQNNLTSGQTMQEQMRMEKDSDGMIDREQEKENINHHLLQSNNNHEENEKSLSVQNGNSEVEQKISVKERMQKFNRIASESELTTGVNSKVSSSRSRREIAAKHESGDFDTASLSSLDPKAKEWMMKAIKCDYPVLNKMAQENPALIRRKDMNYTALHWAAKHGNLECVKLLAGSYKAEVNGKSNGGYTPLHLAAQFGRQEVYDILIKTYNADANMRDHSGKKPMQYLVRQDASMSMDTFKKLKEKRRNTEQQRERDSSFLRIGSLNVKVKSTREAFGYFLGKSTSSTSIERMHKNWGSADNLPETEANDKDKQMMPPPPGIPRHGAKPSKRRHRRAADSLTIKESKSDSDSDTAFGFGSEWVSPVRD